MHINNKDLNYELRYSTLPTKIEGYLNNKYQHFLYVSRETYKF